MQGCQKQLQLVRSHIRGNEKKLNEWLEDSTKGQQKDIHHRRKIQPEVPDHPSFQHWVQKIEQAGLVLGTHLAWLGQSGRGSHSCRKQSVSETTEKRKSLACEICVCPASPCSSALSPVTPTLVLMLIPDIGKSSARNYE